MVKLRHPECAWNKSKNEEIHDNVEFKINNTRAFFKPMLFFEYSESKDATFLPYQNQPFRLIHGMSRNPLKNLSNDQLQVTADYFRALGEPSRLRILQILNSGEKGVTEIAEQAALSQPNASRHLSVLTSVKVVGKRKVGTNVLYRIIDQCLPDVCTLVCKRVSNHRNHRNGG